MIDHLNDLLMARPETDVVELPGPIASHIATLGISERPSNGDFRFRDADPDF